MDVRGLGKSTRWRQEETRGRVFVVIGHKQIARRGGTVCVLHPRCQPADLGFRYTCDRYLGLSENELTISVLRTRCRKRIHPPRIVAIHLCHRPIGWVASLVNHPLFYEMLRRSFTQSSSFIHGRLQPACHDVDRRVEIGGSSPDRWIRLVYEPNGESNRLWGI